MSEESNVFPKSIEIKDYLRNIGLKTDCENILDYIDNSESSFCLSRFPQYVLDYAKYRDVEIFFQKYLDGDITKTEFLECEKKYHQVLQTLWLYDQVYVGIYTDVPSYKKSYYAKRSKAYIKKQHKFIMKIIENYNLIYSVNTLDELDAVLHIGTRDIAPIVLFFKKYEAMVCLDSCSSILYSLNTDFLSLVKKVSLANGLYLIKNRVADTVVTKPISGSAK